MAPPWPPRSVDMCRTASRAHRNAPVVLVRKNAIEPVGLEVGETALSLEDPDVVDEDIDLAESLYGASPEPGDVVFLREISRHRENSATETLHRMTHVGRRVRSLQVRKADVVAALRGKGRPSPRRCRGFRR